MAFSRNENLIDDVTNDIDPTFNGLHEIHADNMSKPEKLEKNPNVDFNTLVLTVYGSTPIRIVGADPARIRMLITAENNTDVVIGTSSDVAQSKGFKLPQHANGGIELQTTQELWATYINASTTANQTIYIYTERYSDI
jgi:hypothetical protein